MRGLISEDNLSAAANIGDYLELAGHQVDFAYNGSSTLLRLKQFSYDLVILDVMMPELSRLDMCRLAREQYLL